MNPQQEALLQQLESQVRQLTHQLSDINFAIHSLRSGAHQPAPRPTPIPALNPRWSGGMPPNLYGQAARPNMGLPWERPHGYSPELRDPLRPSGFIKPDTMSHVFFYEQDCYVLSNFSAFTLLWKGQDFDTSEAAYHWEKFPHHPEIQKAIRDSRSAHEAYKIAERNKDKRRGDWDAVKVNIMKDILLAKVSQHEYVRQKLLETGTRILVEDSWRDDFWGWGPNRNGQNMLGRLWMEIRTELQNCREVPSKKPEAVDEHIKSADEIGLGNLPQIVMATAEYVKVTDDLVTHLSEYKANLKHASDCKLMGQVILPTTLCTCGLSPLLNVLEHLMSLQARYSNIIGKTPETQIPL